MGFLQHFFYMKSQQGVWGGKNPQINRYKNRENAHITVEFA